VEFINIFNKEKYQNMSSKTAAKQRIDSLQGKPGQNGTSSALNSRNDLNTSTVAYDYSFQTAQCDVTECLEDVPTPLLDNRTKQSIRNDNRNGKINNENDMTIAMHQSYSNSYIPNKYESSDRVRNRNLNCNSTTTATTTTIQPSCTSDRIHFNHKNNQCSDFTQVSDSRCVCEGYRSGIRWIIHSDTPGGHWIQPIKIVKGLETLDDDDDDKNAKINNENASSYKSTELPLDRLLEVATRESCNAFIDKDVIEGDKLIKKQEEKTCKTQSNTEVAGVICKNLPPHRDNSKQNETITSAIVDDDRDRRRRRRQEAQANRPKLERQLSGQSLNNFVENSLIPSQINTIDLQHSKHQSDVPTDKRDRHNIDQNRLNKKSSMKKSRSSANVCNNEKFNDVDKLRKGTKDMQRTRSKKDFKECDSSELRRRKCQTSKKDASKDSYEKEKSKSRQRLEPKYTESKTMSDSEEMIEKDIQQWCDRQSLKLPDTAAEELVAQTNLESARDKIISNKDITSTNKKSKSLETKPVLEIIPSSDSAIFNDSMSIDPLNGFIPHKTRHGERRPPKMKHQSPENEKGEALCETKPNANKSINRRSSPKRRSNNNDDGNRKRKDTEEVETKDSGCPEHKGNVESEITSDTARKASQLKPQRNARNCDSLDTKSEHSIFSTNVKSKQISSLDTKSDHQATYHPSRMPLYPRKVRAPKHETDDMSSEVKDVNNGSNYHSSTSSGEVSEVFSVGLGIQYLNQDNAVRALKQKVAASCDMSFAQLNFCISGSEHQPGGVKFVDNDDVAAAAEVAVDPCELSFMKVANKADDSFVNIEEPVDDPEDRHKSRSSSIKNRRKKDVPDNPNITTRGTTGRNKSFFTSRTKNVDDDSNALSPKRVNRSFSIIRSGKTENDEVDRKISAISLLAGSQCDDTVKGTSFKDHKGKEKNSKKKRFLSFGHTSSDVGERSITLLDDDNDE
jgi:hypothetical protein